MGVPGRPRLGTAALRQFMTYDHGGWTLGHADHKRFAADDGGSGATPARCAGKHGVGSCVYASRPRVADRPTSASRRTHSRRATVPLMTGLSAHLTAAAHAAMAPVRKETQVDERSVSAMRAALVARLDAEAEAEHQWKAKAVDEASRDTLVRDDCQDLVERWALYLALAASKTRHASRWNESEGLRARVSPVACTASTSWAIRLYWLR